MAVMETLPFPCHSEKIQQVHIYVADQWLTLGLALGILEPALDVSLQVLGSTLDLQDQEQHCTISIDF